MGTWGPSKRLYYVHCWGTGLVVWWVDQQRSICIEDLRPSWQRTHSTGRKSQVNKC